MPRQWLANGRYINETDRTYLVNGAYVGEVATGPPPEPPPPPQMMMVHQSPAEGERREAYAQGDWEYDEDSGLGLVGAWLTNGEADLTNRVRGNIHHLVKSSPHDYTDQAALHPTAGTVLGARSPFTSGRYYTVTGMSLQRILAERGTMTISGWARRNTSGLRTWQLMAQGSLNSHKISVYRAWQGYVGITAKDIAVNDLTHTWAWDDPGDWMHVVAVFDDSKPNTEHYWLYIDGIWRADNPVSTTFPTGDTDPTYIGADYNGGPANEGMLYDVRVSGKALTDAEVKDSYHRPWMAAKPKRRLRRYVSMPGTTGADLDAIFHKHRTDIECIDAFATGEFELNRRSEQALGLVGWWPMSEGRLRSRNLAGGSDAIMSGINDYAVYNHPVYGAIKLPKSTGSTNVVEADGYSGINELENVTICAWVYTTAKGPQGIITKMMSASAYVYYGFQLSVDNLLLGRIYDQVLTPKDVNWYYMPENEWVHIALTYDNSTGDSSYYVNGRHWEEVAIPAAGRMTAVTHTQQLRLGRLESEHLEGAMCDVRIYDRVLSDAAIHDVAWKGFDAVSACDEDRKRLFSLTGFTSTPLPTPPSRNVELIRTPVIRHPLMDEDRVANFNSNTTKIDWGSHQSKGLIAAFPGNHVTSIDSTAYDFREVVSDYYMRPISMVDKHYRCRKRHPRYGATRAFYADSGSFRTNNIASTDLPKYLPGADGFTFSCWVYLDQATPSHQMINNGVYMYFHAVAPRQNRFSVGFISPTEVGVQNEWNFYAVSYVTATGDLTFNTNGVTETYTTSSGTNLDAATYVSCLSSDNHSVDFRIYNRPLKAWEMQEIYKRPEQLWLPEERRETRFRT